MKTLIIAFIIAQTILIFEVIINFNQTNQIKELRSSVWCLERGQIYVGDVWCVDK